MLVQRLSTVPQISGSLHLFYTIFITTAHILPLSQDLAVMQHIYVLYFEFSQV